MNAIELGNIAKLIGNVACLKKILTAILSVLITPLVLLDRIEAMSDKQNTSKLTSRHLQQETAIVEASRFLKAVGQPGNLPVQIVYSDRDLGQDTDYYYASLWHISFVTGPTIDISDETGKVVSYSYGPVSKNVRRVPSIPRGKELSREEALSRSKAILSELYIDDDLRLDTIEIDKGNKPEIFGSGSWVSRWARYKSNIPYDNQDVVIRLDAETGQLIGLIVRFSTSLAKTVIPNVSEKEAHALGASTLKQKNISAKYSGAQLTYVSESTYTGLNSKNSQPRLVWRVSFIDDTVDDLYYFINIDAITKEIGHIQKEGNA